ncbi:hypothetical protein [Lacisediminimonas profundi]|uniref:hypothetical protein n=1 Tax=Lacisediminimonas profundi TaxID=2603856 RepID=UPI00124AEB87|nr:hypothetical protein [Lacisediminimonas profundi]
MNKATPPKAIPTKQKGGHAYTVPGIHPGVNLAITGEGYGAVARDYCNMRATQLCALLNVISGEGHNNFMLYGDEIQDDVMWLARSLAEEIKSLIPIVADEGERSTGGAA